MTSDLFVQPRAELVAWTQFAVPRSVVETTPYRLGEGDAEFREGGGEDLVEFAGRACYQSWSRPNPATATVEGYIGNILDVGHGSVLEHGHASFYLTGVSRSLTHELVRHRAGFAYSQLSQRYVDSSDVRFVVPPEMREPSAYALLDDVAREALRAYELAYDGMRQKLESEGAKGVDARKRARQAARCVLPNMTETRIVVTGNYRAWRHFLRMRASVHADVEIREVAMLIYEELVDLAPAVVQDARAVVRNGTQVLEFGTET